MTLEAMISYSGDTQQPATTFDLALFKALNVEFASRPVVPAPRAHSTAYTGSIGRNRGAMLERKIGIDGLRVLEIGCGDGMLSRTLADERGCEVVGVDIQAYDAWKTPHGSNLSYRVHDVSAGDNAAFGQFDRVVSFAVFEHIVHPHGALKAAFDLLKPGGKAYVYANLHRGAKASHRYREVFFPWPHLLFPPAVWREFYVELVGEPLQPAWVNKLTYDQYLAMAERIGFRVAEHFPSAPYFDEEFYKRFEYELSAYPKFDLMHDFIHLVLEKPAAAAAEKVDRQALLDFPPRRADADAAHAKAFWQAVRAGEPEWLRYEPGWRRSRRKDATPIEDAQPWVTFPAIDFLDRYLTKRHRVFEWGSGGSTLFFAERAGTVVSIEHERTWFEAVQRQLAARENVSYQLIEPEAAPPGSWRHASGARGGEDLDFRAYVEAIEEQDEAGFDLVVVDGRARMGCLAAGAAKVAPGGWLLLDNANYPRYRERLAELRATVLRGWREVDLAGPGPYSRTPAWQTLAWQCPAAPAAPKLAGASALRRALARMPVRPYDRVSYCPVRMSPAEVARVIAGEPFKIWELEFAFGKTANWTSKRGEPRSKALFLHSWGPLEPLFAHASETGDAVVLAFLCDKVGRWIDRFGTSALDGAAKHGPGDAESFIGYDTSISDRFFRLAWLVAAAASVPAIGHAYFAKLVAALVAHRKALMRDENFSAHTNHGLFQAMAQVCGASRFLSHSGRSGAAMLGMKAAYEQGKARLLTTLAAQLAPDGVHREHSPMYHVILANSLDWVADHSIVTDRVFGETVERMRAAAAWMFDAQGHIANLGDSDLEADPPYPVLDAIAPAAPAQAAFPEGGYWFVKGPEVYLAQAAAFHSRVHKQADTGAFLWRDRGVDILVEPGRFGYVGRTAPGDPAFRDGFWYGDARRRYVESTRAHNTLSVDGRNHPRFRSPPFGSGIEAVVEANGVFACETSIRNLPRLTHSRLVLLKPSEWLLCVDLLRARDEAAHLAAQHFHFHPDWHLKRRRHDGALLHHPGGQDLYVSCVFEDASIGETARGRGASRGSDPDALGGWWSPRHMAFEPCQAISVTAEGEHLALATLFTFAGVEIDRAFTGFNATRRRLRFRWTGPGGAESVTVDRETDEDGHRRLRLT